MNKLYCSTCQKNVGPVKLYNEKEELVISCPLCQKPLNDPYVRREADRGQTNTEVSLAESFEEIGLSEEGARIAAKVRGGPNVPDDVTSDEAKLEASLIESFSEMGLSEDAAKIAAKGHK